VGESKIKSAVSSFGNKIKVELNELKDSAKDIAGDIVDYAVASPAGQKVAEAVAGQINTHAPRILMTITTPVIDGALEGAPEAVKHAGEHIQKAFLNPEVGQATGQEVGKTLLPLIGNIVPAIAAEVPAVCNWASDKLNLNPEHVSIKEAIQKEIVAPNPNIIRRIFGKLLEWGGNIFAFLGARIFSHFDNTMRDPNDKKKYLLESENALKSVLSGAILKGWIKLPEKLEPEPQHSTPSPLRFSPQPA
jgi:hypothetical protein